MKYNPDTHQRRPIRLKGFNYAQAGAYFVTICTRERECLFGDVVDGKVQMNDMGRGVQTVWENLPKRYPGVSTDAFIVMPNHVHGIVVITDHVGAGLALPNKKTMSDKLCPINRAQQAAPPHWGTLFVRLNPCLRLV